jgi:hypothetical protein
MSECGTAEGKGLSGTALGLDCGKRSSPCHGCKYQYAVEPHAGTSGSREQRSAPETGSVGWLAVRRGSGPSCAAWLLRACKPAAPCFGICAGECAASGAALSRLRRAALSCMSLLAVSFASCNSHARVPARASHAVTEAACLESDRRSTALSRSTAAQRLRQPGSDPDGAAASMRLRWKPFASELTSATTGLPRAMHAMMAAHAASRSPARAHRRAGLRCLRNSSDAGILMLQPRLNAPPY